jgi:NADH dehydrogenase
MSQKHRVIILGGGFGGLVCARTLCNADAEITLIDKRNFHLFQPLLYQVATGSLSPGEIAAPLRSVLSKQKNTQVLLGEAVDIDPVAQTVMLLDGAVFPYDTLVVSTGSQTSYYGKNEWREYAPSLKSVEEATAMRRKLLLAFEEAERCNDPAQTRAWLTFVIVGGGATGLELAGALAEIARETLRHDFRKIRPEEARIVVMEGGPRVLSAFPEDLSAKGEALVRKLGVEVRKGTMVTAIGEDGVSFKQGVIDADGVSFNQGDKADYLPAKTVLWAGGVMATGFGETVAARTNAQTDRAGKIKVMPDLTIPGFPNIFVTGDMALALSRGKDGQEGKPLPGVAQVAIQGGRYAAKAILARLKGKKEIAPFHYFDKGDMAVIGRAAAIADIFGLHFSGLLAWLIWLFIHLMYIVEFQSRVQVFVQWGFEYATFSRGARLITGSGKETPME